MIYYLNPEISKSIVAKTIKIVLFLYQFYINDESNRLIFLIMFILFEYFSELFDSNIKKINFNLNRNNKSGRTMNNNNTSGKVMEKD